MTIFVSIAAYRDPELVPTIRDLFAKADHPEALRVVVCDQFGPEAPELPADLAADPRIERIAIPWRESRGACWARALIQDRFADEDYYLQLDSHHRFVESWDTEMVRELKDTGRAKALLTGYVNAYHPAEPLDASLGPQELHFDAFHADGIAVFAPWGMLPREGLPRPVRARFISGHFIFAPGAFVREVPYDRELYFIGEEISLSVRAFMEGWYLYHPSKVLLFHEYTRAYRENKHWSDHEEGEVERPWHTYDTASRLRVTALLHDRDARGSVRSMRQYEDYAGLCFPLQRVHPATLDGAEPPTPVEPGWAEAGDRYAFFIEVPAAILDEEAAAEYWRLVVYDENARLIVRLNIWPENLRLAERNGDTLRLPLAFDSDVRPVEWVLEPSASTELSHVRGRIDAFRPEPPKTFVTALLDLGREALPDPRPYEEYRARLAELLRSGIGHHPVVVYCHPDDAAFVRSCRGAAPIEVRPLSLDMLRDTPGFGEVERLRQRPEWRAQADWLAASPQALLSGYAALVLHKLRLLGEVARGLPDRHQVWWVDAGLTRTVAPFAVTELTRSPPSDTLRFFAYPYPVDHHEVHGFAREGLDRLAGRPVTHVLRGGCFGGPSRVVESALEPYERLLQQSLSEGLLGTEESLFAILWARGEPAFSGAVEIGADGLIPCEPCGRLPLAVELPDGPDRLALKCEVLRIASLDRAGAPAHLLFRGPNAWAHLALLAPWARQGDILDVERADGGPAPTMAFVRDVDVARARSTLAPLPAPEWITRFVQTAPSREPPLPNAGTTAAVYVLSFDAPGQFEHWLRQAELACPELLSAPVKVLVNNSTTRATFAAYDELCERYGFTEIHLDNVGITGGRIAATRHFLAESGADQMWYFEDDMCLEDRAGVCRNGMPTRYPGLYATVTQIVAYEDELDLLKLSFSELFGCHQLDWAWVNTDPEARSEAFPEGSATQFRTIRSSNGLAWGLGDVHYSHWPSVLTRRGAALLFGGASPPSHETEAMLHAHALQRAGELRCAVLLASPIRHERAQSYEPSVRVEFRAQAGESGEESSPSR